LNSFTRVYDLSNVCEPLLIAGQKVFFNSFTVIHFDFIRKLFCKRRKSTEFIVQIVRNDCELLLNLKEIRNFTVLKSWWNIFKHYIPHEILDELLRKLFWVVSFHLVLSKIAFFPQKEFASMILISNCALKLYIFESSKSKEIFSKFEHWYLSSSMDKSWM